MASNCLTSLWILEKTCSSKNSRIGLIVCTLTDRRSTFTNAKHIIWTTKRKREGEAWASVKVGKIESWSNRFKKKTTCCCQDDGMTTMLIAGWLWKVFCEVQEKARERQKKQKKWNKKTNQKPKDKRERLYLKRESRQSCNSFFHRDSHLSSSSSSSSSSCPSSSPLSSSSGVSSW